MELIVGIIALVILYFAIYSSQEERRKKERQAEWEKYQAEKQKEEQAEAHSKIMQEQEEKEGIAAENYRTQRIKQVREAREREAQLFGHLERAKTEMAIVERHFLIERDVQSFWSTIAVVISSYEASRNLLPQIIDDMYKYQGKPSMTTFQASISPSTIFDTLQLIKKLSSLITQALQIPEFRSVYYERTNQIFSDSKSPNDILFNIYGMLAADLRNYESTARELRERHQ